MQPGVLSHGHGGGGLIPAGRGFRAERIDPPLILVKEVLLAAGTAVMSPFPATDHPGYSWSLHDITRTRPRRQAGVR